MIKQTRELRLWALFALMLLVSAHGLGQTSADFVLFEPVEASSNAASTAPGARNSRASSPGRNANNEPVFSLVGTSRIGSRLTVALRHLGRDERIRVVVNGTRTPIPGHELYALLEVEGRRVGVQYPQSETCREFFELGVSCDAESNIAMLSLTTAKALNAEQGDQVAAVAPEDSPTADTPRNPFEALRNAADRGASRNAADPPAPFQPRRIDPSEVPPGKRVVSTPFGDRVVDN